MEFSSLKFVVCEDGGVRRELSVDSDVALVGSGAHCEIRLPAEHAAPEQLRLQVRAGAVFAEARSLSPLTLLNGAPFTQGRLLPGSSLRVGNSEISVEVARAQAPTKLERKESARSKFVYVLGAIGFPLGFWMLLNESPSAAQEVHAVAPPALFDGASAACAESAPGPAQAQAESELGRAESLRERAPFEAEEGVDAVAAFARSAACFKAAGQADEAARATQAAEDLKRRMNREFRLHQVRLEWARSTQHHDEARKEVRLLLSFVGRRGGEYANWLSALDRQIELSYSGKKE
ncbi:MAG: FHA domain-containing protein [Polyangiaceae bacterium]